MKMGNFDPSLLFTLFLQLNVCNSLKFNFANAKTHLNKIVILNIKISRDNFR